MVVRLLLMTSLLTLLFLCSASGLVSLWWVGWDGMGWNGDMNIMSEKKLYLVM